MEEEKIFVYTADNEEPDCMQCEHVCDSYEKFCSKCGPKYYWYNYVRIEIENEEKNYETYLSKQNSK